MSRLTSSDAMDYLEEWRRRQAEKEQGQFQATGFSPEGSALLTGRPQAQSMAEAAQQPALPADPVAAMQSAASQSRFVVPNSLPSMFNSGQTGNIPVLAQSPPNTNVGDSGQLPVDVMRMALGGAAAVAPVSRFEPTTQGVGPNLPQHVVTIKNAGGDVLSQMGYGQTATGDFTPGQLLARRAGYNAQGDWENGIANGAEQSRGPMTPIMALQDAYQKNLADRTGSPFGYGMDNRTAFAQALQVGNLANEAAQQQNQFKMAQMADQAKIEAARQAHQHNMNAAQYQAAINAHLSGQGNQFARADQFARGLGAPAGADGGMIGPTMPAAAIPQNEALDPTQRVNQFLLQNADQLPKTFQYGLPGVGKNGPMQIQGQLGDKLTPAATAELLNRMAAAKFSQPEAVALADALGRSVGGNDIRKALIGQIFNDQVTANPPAVVDKSWLPAAIPGLLGRTNVYPAELVGMEGFPGAKVVSNVAETRLGAGLKSLADRFYNGGLPYRGVQVNGETIPFDPGSNMATLGNIFGGNEAIKRQIAARQSISPALYQALAGIR